MSAWVEDRRRTAFEKHFSGFGDPNDNQTNPKAMDNSHVKYWPEGRFTINARGLKIDNSDRSEYWQWKFDRYDNEEAEVAAMVKGTWLSARGSFKTVNLVYGKTYRVSFLLKMTQDSTMNEKTVNLKLSLPGFNQEKQGKLPASPDKWRELEVGQFKMTAQNVGDMNFAMEQLFEERKGGLIIMRVDIKPVITSSNIYNKSNAEQLPSRK